MVMSWMKVTMSLVVCPLAVHCLRPPDLLCPQAYESVECLKAQVLQEQQLRSVTEGCLMEERAAWDQGRQVVLNTRSMLHTLGDLMSRLR